MYNVKYIMASVVLASVLCAGLISCTGGEGSPEMPDGTMTTATAADTSAEYDILTETVGTADEEAAAEGTSATAGVNMVVTGVEVTLAPPAVTNRTEAAVTGTTAKKTESAATTAAKKEEPEQTTTQPLIQIMSNGDIVLPDDEWD